MKYRKKPVVIEAVRWTGREEAMPAVLALFDAGIPIWRSINDADVYPPLHEISYAIESRPAEAGGGKTP